MSLLLVRDAWAAFRDAPQDAGWIDHVAAESSSTFRLKKYLGGGMQFRLLLCTLVALGRCAVATAADFTSGEILVRFRDATTVQERRAFEQVESLVFLREIESIRVRLYQLPEKVDVRSAVDRFSRNPIVDFAEPNYTRDVSQVSDPSYPNQWSLHNTGQRVNGVAGPAGIDIRWPEAMALFRGTRTVNVAVIDSGVALDHPDILASAFSNAAELTAFGGRTGVDDDRNGYIDDFSGYDFYAQDPLPLDEFGHGTIVASIIAGVGNNGIGGTGISPTARIMSLRVLNQFGRGGVPKFARVSDIALALDYAQRNGARVVNLSLGGTSSSSTELLVLRSLNTAGVLVVAAAGNGGEDGIGDNNDTLPTYPASYDVENIISVAAQDRSGGLASFSNYGAQRVHIAAPGTQIFGADVTRRTVFYQDFQGGTAGWVVGSSPGNISPYVWSLSSTADRYLIDRLTGPTYAPFTNTWVRSPLISLAGTLGARLTFDIYFDLADDYLFIEASPDGVNWYTYNYIAGSSDFVSATYSIDISEFDGAVGYFRFRLVSNSGFQGLGVAINNVSITSVTLFDPGAPRFQYLQGTSFSAPMVAGVASLLMSQRPDLSASQVRSIILDSARPVSALGGKVKTGGMLDAQQALLRAINTPFPAAPSINTAIAAQTVAVGQSVTFVVSAAGTAPLTYQWRKDGIAISGATASTLTLSGVQVGSAGAYSVTVTNSLGSITSNAASLSVAIPNPGRLINLSVLTDITSVGDGFTLGYVVGGAGTSGPKPLVIRAAGPSLGALGVAGTIADPKLEIFAGANKTGENDNWGGSAQLVSALMAVGAFAYTGPNSRDAAIFTSIGTRDNSVSVSGVGANTGKVIAEIYDATPTGTYSSTTPRLLNVSVRKHLGSGLTAGFVVGGATPVRVLVRAVGPGLSVFSVPGVVSDPQLTLFNDKSARIGENNDWGGTTELNSAFSAVGAFSLPTTSRDAAVLVTLQPGLYSVQVSGVAGSTGVALVEVYEVP